MPQRQWLLVFLVVAEALPNLVQWSTTSSIQLYSANVSFTYTFCKSWKAMSSNHFWYYLYPPRQSEVQPQCSYLQMRFTHHRWGEAWALAHSAPKPMICSGYLLHRISYNLMVGRISSSHSCNILMEQSRSWIIQRLSRYLEDWAMTWWTFSRDCHTPLLHLCWMYLQASKPKVN